jgi:hypothetical protein
MPAIAVVAAQLIAGPPKPVICLDTCDILEVVQCLDWEKERTPRSVSCIEPARRLLSFLAVDPHRAQVVITDLVHHEWTQNIAAIEQKARDFLAKIDNIVGYPYQAAALAGTVLAVAPSLSASALVADLASLSTNLLGQAVRLDLEDPQIRLALDRVLSKRRPSHEGHIKDSINFEHYLELARRLRAGGFMEDVVFVSKNRRDYWEPGTTQILHELLPEINDPAVRITFFASLAAALGPLGI